MCANHLKAWWIASHGEELVDTANTHFLKKRGSSEQPNTLGENPRPIKTPIPWTQPDLSQNQPTNRHPLCAKHQHTKKLNDFPIVSNRSFLLLALASRSPDSTGFPRISSRLFLLMFFAQDDLVPANTLFTLTFGTKPRPLSSL